MRPKSTLSMGAAMMAITGLGTIADAVMDISHLHVIVSGLEAALGLVLVALAWYGVRQGHMWAWITASGAFLVVLAAVFPIHYVYGLATLSHLGMSYMGALMFVMGAFMALGPLRGDRERGGLRQVQTCCAGLRQKDPHEAAVGSGSHVG